MSGRPSFGRTLAVRAACVAFVCLLWAQEDSAHAMDAAFAEYCQAEFAQMQAVADCRVVPRAAMLEQARRAATVCYAWMRAENQWEVLADYLERCDFERRTGEDAGGVSAGVQFVARGRCGLRDEVYTQRVATVFRGLETLADRLGEPSEAELTRLELIARSLSRLLVDAERCPDETDDTLDELFRVQLQHVPVVVERFQDVVDEGLLLDLVNARGGISMYGGFRGYALRGLALQRLIRDDPEGFVELSISALADALIWERGESVPVAQWAADAVHLACDLGQVDRALGAAEQAMSRFGAPDLVPQNLIVAYRRALALWVEARALREGVRSPESPSAVDAYLDRLARRMEWREFVQATDEALHEVRSQDVLDPWAPIVNAHALVSLEPEEAWNRVAWTAGLVRQANANPHLLPAARATVLPVLLESLSALDHPDFEAVRAWRREEMSTVAMHLPAVDVELVLDAMEALIASAGDVEPVLQRTLDSLRFRYWLGEGDERVGLFVEATKALVDRDLHGYGLAMHALDATGALGARERGILHRGHVWLDPPPRPAGVPDLTLRPYTRIGPSLEHRSGLPGLLSAPVAGVELAVGTGLARIEVEGRLRLSVGTHSGLEAIAYRDHREVIEVQSSLRAWGWSGAVAYRLLGSFPELVAGVSLGMEHMVRCARDEEVVGSPTRREVGHGVESGVFLRLEQLVWGWEGSSRKGVRLYLSPSGAWVTGRLDGRTLTGFRWALSTGVGVDFPW